jgi:hypothetical protein
LAELVAPIIGIVVEYVTDTSALHGALNRGKWNTYLEFREDVDFEELIVAVWEANVV